MSTDLRIKLLSGVLIVLTVAVAVFFWQQRPDTVTLGELSGAAAQDTLWLDEQGEADPDAPLVLNETGEMVPARTPRIVGDTIDTQYECPTGEIFTTGYDLSTNALLLTLPDDTEYVLPQAVATSGARYAKWDDSVIFFEEAGSAEVVVDDELIFQDCVAAF